MKKLGSYLEKRDSIAIEFLIVNIVQVSGSNKGTS